MRKICQVAIPGQTLWLAAAPKSKHFQPQESWSAAPFSKGIVLCDLLSLALLSAMGINTMTSFSNNRLCWMCFYLSCEAYAMPCYFLGNLGSRAGADFADARPGAGNHRSNQRHTYRRATRP